MRCNKHGVKNTRYSEESTLETLLSASWSAAVSIRSQPPDSLIHKYTAANCTAARLRPLSPVGPGLRVSVRTL